MKTKKMSLWLMISMLIMVGIPLGANSGNQLFTQSQTGPSTAQGKSIGVMPFFKGRCDADMGGILDCLPFQLSFDPENLSGGSDRILTRYVQEALHNRYAGKVIPLSEATEVYERMFKDTVNDTLRTLARRLGKALEVDLILAGTLWRFTERAGGTAGGSYSSASVAFAMYLVEVPSGKLLWKGDFDKTQRPLSENILGAKDFFKKGARWLSVDELARRGVEEVFKKSPL
jgi:hypothetical protein